jgi:hypothetical protein
MSTIGSNPFSDSVVSVRPQQDLHQLFERRPDTLFDIEGFIRSMSEGAQCRKAACQNAGLRVD